jgi:hypothetical protein
LGDFREERKWRKEKWGENDISTRVHSFLSSQIRKKTRRRMGGHETMAILPML